MAIPGAVDAADPTVRLTYQACDDRRCLPPVSRQLPVAAPRTVSADP